MPLVPARGGCIRAADDGSSSNDGSSSDGGSSQGDGSSSNGGSSQGEGSSENVDKSKLWWLMLIPADSLLAWGISKIAGGDEGSSVPGQPKPNVPGDGESKKDEPKKDDPKADEPKVDEPKADESSTTDAGAPVSKDAPRQDIKTVPSGATKLEDGIVAYI